MTALASYRGFTLSSSNAGSRSTGTGMVVRTSITGGGSAKAEDKRRSRRMRKGPLRSCYSHLSVTVFSKRRGIGALGLGTRSNCSSVKVGLSTKGCQVITVNRGKDKGYAVDSPRGIGFCGGGVASAFFCCNAFGIESKRSASSCVLLGETITRFGVRVASTAVPTRTRDVGFCCAKNDDALSTMANCKYMRDHRARDFGLRRNGESCSICAFPHRRGGNLGVAVGVLSTSTRDVGRCSGRNIPIGHGGVARAGVDVGSRAVSSPSRGRSNSSKGKGLKFAMGPS